MITWDETKLILTIILTMAVMVSVFWTIVQRVGEARFTLPTFSLLLLFVSLVGYGTAYVIGMTLFDPVYAAVEITGSGLLGIYAK